MKIFNVMLGRRMGGTEQAFLDYSHGFRRQGVDVCDITSSRAIVNTLHAPDKILPNWVPWCLVTRFLLNRRVRRDKPDFVIAHGGRAIEVACAATPKGVPVVGVTHLPNATYLKKADYLLAITSSLKAYMVDQGYPEDRIFTVPNMIRLEKAYIPPVIPKNRPFVVGSYGRFAEQKGYRYLIEAVACLKDRGKDVQLILGGEGELEGALKQQVQALGLQDQVTFPGWIQDKEAFFNAIDVFCLSSIHEPFELVLLEAMMYSTPLVSTNVSGPAEILKDGEDALLCKPGSGKAMADRIYQLMAQPDLIPTLSKKAHEKVTQTYGMATVSKQLMATLGQIVEHRDAPL